jgi:hypothetical protein
MPIPAEPYIDIVTGIVYGNIVEGLPFNWYNSNMSSSCTISGYSEWCTMPSNIVGPGMAQPATAREVDGVFTYSSPCLNAPSPVIVVHPVMDEKHKKSA